MTDAQVISLDVYREEKRVVLIDEDCPRPFHLGKYVIKKKPPEPSYCVKCDTDVRLQNHPSMEHKQWYG